MWRLPFWPVLHTSTEFPENGDSSSFFLSFFFFLCSDIDKTLYSAVMLQVLYFIITLHEYYRCKNDSKTIRVMHLCFALNNWGWTRGRAVELKAFGEWTAWWCASPGLPFRLEVNKFCQTSEQFPLSSLVLSWEGNINQKTQWRSSHVLSPEGLTVHTEDSNNSCASDLLSQHDKYLEVLLVDWNNTGDCGTLMGALFQHRMSR